MNQLKPFGVIRQGLNGIEFHDVGCPGCKGLPTKEQCTYGGGSERDLRDAVDAALESQEECRSMPKSFLTHHITVGYEHGLRPDQMVEHLWNNAGMLPENRKGQR